MKFKRVLTWQERFAMYVRKTSVCWLWTGYKTRSGYGVIVIDGKNRRAHRIAYELAFSKPPRNLFVCHKCDVPNCVNPDHLFLGTPSDNSRDMVAKHRGTVGTKNRHAKLTDKDVREIRSMAEEGSVIARRYGISRDHVYQIKLGRRWTHLKTDTET